MIPMHLAELSNKLLNIFSIENDNVCLQIILPNLYIHEANMFITRWITLIQF